MEEAGQNLPWENVKMIQRTGKILTRLNEMLDSAISGQFEESCYDESKLSRLESKWKRFLSGSHLSASKREEEKNNIKNLISDISHQTKTPLSNILLYTQLAKEKNTDSALAPLLERIENQTEKLHFLMQSLVKVSHLEQDIIALSPKRQPLSPMLECVMAQAQGEASRKQISLTLTSNKEQAYFDSKWTEEAILNLVENAIKYSDKESSICITVKGYEFFTAVCVADQGIGIREEEQPQIFGRFYRGREVTEEKGVGIGLYLAREIAVRQGGYLKVASQYGKGSVFSFFLPKGV